MKNTKRCPKCSSNEIYRVEAVVGNGYASGNIIPTGLIRMITVNRYICGRCVYAEEWIEGKDLEVLKMKFQKI